MPRKTPPHKYCPEWTESKFNTHIRGALRKSHDKWPPKDVCIEKAKREIPIEERRERGIKYRTEYQCNICKQWFPKTIKGKQQLQSDHIEPVGTSLEGFDNFIENLFRPEEDYQCLCKECHKIKSKNSP